MCSSREGVKYCEAHLQYPLETFNDWQMNEISLMGTAHPHGYLGCASWVLHTLTGTVLPVCLMGTWGASHGYCTPSQVLHTLTSTAHSHKYCTPSQVLHILHAG